MSLKDLESELNAEFSLLGYPKQPWLPPSQQEVLDVAIIGGGMAGLCAAFALMLEGISNLGVYDEARSGYEGPWDTYARMPTLRSGKQLTGPALQIPKLTFQAWYCAQYGEEAWEELYKIPTPLWMDYLRWYRKTLNIPLENDAKVLALTPTSQGIELQLQNREPTRALKVIIATGRSGFGGLRLPDFAKTLPKNLYAHTSEKIDFEALCGKDILVVGSGASGFDAAAKALEHGAAHVTMLTRRDKLPNVNKFAGAVYPGFGNGYFLLDDTSKMRIMENAKQAGSPPPFEALDRLKGHRNIALLTGFKIQDVNESGNRIAIASPNRVLSGDFLILATGFNIDGEKEGLLKPIFKEILLWKDKYPDLTQPHGQSPYLGSHYQFLEKLSGTAPYLKDIYCFNYAATMTHGLTSSDIPDISVGAERLSKGIVADFFTGRKQIFVKRFLDYSVEEFDEGAYPFICRTSD